MLLRGDVTENLWGFLRRPRRADAAGQPTPSRRDPQPVQAPSAAVVAIPSRAVPPTTARHLQRVEAHKLAGIMIRALAKGEHRFRALKEDFDASCEELGIASISDKRFATWLVEAGCKRRRIDRENITVYRVPGRAAMTRLAA
jgi:hypothetical protein